MTHRPTAFRGAALALLGIGLLGACADPAATATQGGPGVVAASSAAPMPACTGEYAAVLDLAALARSYGAGAGLFVDALDAQFERLDDCLTAHGTAGLRDAAGRPHDGGALPIAAVRR